MGYIVGRNSAPAAPEVATSRKETKPPAVDSQAATQTSPARETTSQQPPATDAAKPAEPAKETRLEPFQTEPKAKKPASPASAVSAAASNDEPVEGQTYLQLAAT